jgi:hypothetical protein
VKVSRSSRSQSGTRVPNLDKPCPHSADHFDLDPVHWPTLMRVLAEL